MSSRERSGTFEAAVVLPRMQDATEGRGSDMHATSMAGHLLLQTSPLECPTLTRLYLHPR